MNIVITGAAGYIGTLLIEKLSADPAVKTIICIDRLSPSEAARQIPKTEWIAGDLATLDLRKAVNGHGRTHGPAVDVVIHCAFNIRNPYGRTKETETENLAAARNVFAFAFDAGAKKLIYLSSVAAYGARKENEGVLLKETAPLTETVNPYGYQKALVERVLLELMHDRTPATGVSVLRLNSVTGPRGQSMASKFGLITFLRKLLPFVIKAGPHWARQFVHEEDVRDAIIHIAKRPAAAQENPAIYNVAPKKFLTANDIARILKKRTLRIPARAVRPLFAIAWHGTHGRIPTPPEAAAGLIFPINVDGTKIESTGFTYRYTAEEALLAKGK